MTPEPPPSQSTPFARTSGTSRDDAPLASADNGGTDAAPLSPTGVVSRFVAAVRFLLPFGGDSVYRSHEVRPGILPWIVPVGLLIGLAWVGGFRLSRWLYWETSNMRMVPSLAVVLLETLVTGPFLVLGLARTVHVLAGRHPLEAERDRMAPLSPVGTLVLALVVLTQYVFILSLRDLPGWWPAPNDWRHHFNFLYPRPIYRPLLLAPVWGRWGILLAASIGRPAPGADAQTVAMSAAMSPGRLVRNSLLPFALTAVYCSRSRNIFTGLTIGLLVFGLTYVVTMAVARRGGGQTRQSLFAAGQVAQLAFLATYRALWRLIDG